MILDPCQRPGYPEDWWENQHENCTGSQHDACGRETICDCSCHLMIHVTTILTTPSIVACR